MVNLLAAPFGSTYKQSSHLTTTTTLVQAAVTSHRGPKCSPYFHLPALVYPPQANSALPKMTYLTLSTLISNHPSRTSLLAHV